MEKTVVITGGQGDIAKAIAGKLEALGGYRVLRPGKTELDVTDITGVGAYFAGKEVDILINNAGAVFVQPIGGCDLYKTKLALDVNLFGVFNCTAAVLKKNRNAQIINIGSSAATKLHGTWSSYCASKAGVVMATKCWAEDGVNTVCLSPGRTETKMRKGLFPNEDTATLLKPEDFADIVLRAIEGRYKAGAHIDVNVNNVEALKHEA